MRKISCLVLTAVIISLVSGCATSEVTMPNPSFELEMFDHSKHTLALLPYGSLPFDYGEQLSNRYARWFAPRMYSGNGEVYTFETPFQMDEKTLIFDTNTEIALAIYNRLRGYSVFRRVIIVESVEEAAQYNADYLMLFNVNECYTKGLGANWNFVEWITNEGNIDLDIAVYDFKTMNRILAQNYKSVATSTCAWATRDVRQYLRYNLLKGATLHNLVTQISF